ncbi:signal transduction protein containing a membrane domain an EAL and a GGDEF domain [Oceanococcus atlanticus]|uniref:Signal transduction protein containing a membrane domain an EAL and a GGDEF domain n=1 Tax=Oceanococcus atlanticus TaxID=1317117 RepID=A0A1Y1SBB4_9GAMM|nr:signal transduction protein containing a membrane domain an EAL and a GGDEF domain [Oceanococcus atlanticus]
MPFLDVLYERYGRLKVGFWLTLVLFAIICCCGLFILSELVLRPAIAELPYSASSDQVLDVLFPWFVVFAIVAIVSAAGLIRFGLVAPVLQRRRELEADLASAPPREQIETLSEQKARLGDQLDAVLDDNIVLREDAVVLRQGVALAQDVQRALVASSNEALLLVGPDASVQQVSSPMAALLKIRVQDAPTQPAAELVKVFDASKDKPFEYPLKRVVEDAIAQASSIPKLHDVVLVDQSGNEHRVMLSVQAMQDRHNAVCGALVRVEGSDVGAGRSSERTRGKGGGMAGLPGRDMFDTRVAELMSIAKSQTAEHCLALVAFDNMAEVYQAHGYWAVEEMLWQLAQLIKDEFGSAVELYHANIMHFAVVQAFDSPEIVQIRAERLRKLVEAHEFRWNKKTYRATISVALSALNQTTDSMTRLVNDCDQELREARALGGNRVSLQLTDEVEVMARSIDERLVSWLAMDADETRLQMQSFELAGEGEDKPWIVTQIRVEMEDGFWADPGAFLTSAARVGLLPKIDLWLVGRVLGAMQASPALATSHGPVFVPLHIQSLADEGFVDTLKDQVLDSGVDTQRLIFGLDDFDCATHASSAAEFVKAMREAGFGFALTGARVASASQNITALKPQIVALHPTIYHDDNQSRAAATLGYMSALGEALDFLPVVLEPVDASTSTSLAEAGVKRVARSALGVGPLY